MAKGRRTVYGKIRTGMAVLGAFLLFFLVGKAVLAVPWQAAGDGASVRAKDGIAFITSLVWKQSYPAIGMDSRGAAAAEGREGRTAKVPWYMERIFSSIPLYRYLISQSSEGWNYKEEDPAYIKYLQQQEIYNEHEYLFRNGTEETGENVTDPAPEESQTAQAQTQAPSVETATPAYKASGTHQIVGKQYVLEQLADYDFLMKNFYNIHPSTTAGRDLMDAGEMLSQNFTLTSGNEKPQILIYHTHSQETYADYGPEHQDGNVVGIGNYLTGLLQQKGYNVIHDTSVYDLHDGKLDRNKAYTYALEGITAILQENPSIEVILDVHRDGVADNVHLVNEVNGKQTASIMFFNGTSQTPTGPIEYLQNPYRMENLAFSLQMKLNAEAYYPGLTRKIYLKGLRYNLHLRPRSALLEVGAQTNTTQEAMNAMEPLAELLDIILQGN